jgi:hypothetical protein
MEYLKPIEQLKARIKFDQGIIFGLLVLVGLLLIAVPQILKGEPYLLKTTDDLPTIIQSEPWKLSVSRTEAFSHEYLEARFHWSASTISKTRDRLKIIAGESIFSKFKDSLSANDSLAQNQKAESYYALEHQEFSNALDQAEIHITRVLRIRNVALATPLVIKFSVKQTAVSEQNPYGLVLDELDEEEARDASSGEVTQKR